MGERTAIIAHRGASHAERENTLDAFRRAAAMGADAAELDVRVSADGVLVVHHDPVLPDGRPVRETPAADLPHHVPTLGDALDAAAGMWVNVEIKNDPAEPAFDADRAVAAATVDLLVRRGDPERYLISSFDLATVDRCRAVAPAIATAFLCVTAPDGVVAALVAGGHRALHPWHGRLSEALVDECHAAGLRVNTWTCDDPDRMAELIRWGVDGICTNDPDVGVAVRRRVLG